jgi:hypothetical protein
MNMTTAQAEEFWRWFQREVLPSLILDHAPSDEAISELDERMRELGVSWELGPAPDGSNDWRKLAAANQHRTKLQSPLRVNMSETRSRCLNGEQGSGRVHDRAIDKSAERT